MIKEIQVETSFIDLLWYLENHENQMEIMRMYLNGYSDEAIMIKLNQLLKLEDEQAIAKLESEIDDLPFDERI